MSTHPTRTSADPLHQWATELCAGVVDDLPTPAVDAIVAAASAATAPALATAAAVAVQGGATMTSMTLEAAGSGELAAKIATGCIAAVLAVSGTAAVTGTLPDPAQELAADAAASIGITLPRPGAGAEAEAEASVSGSLDLGASTIIDAGRAGRVGVTLDDDGLRLTAAHANAGFTANVTVESNDAILVEFHGHDETVSVMLTNVDGSVAASTVTTGRAEGAIGTTGGSADADTGATSHLDGKVDPGDTGASVSGEADVEVDIGVGIDLGG